MDKKMRCAGKSHSWLGFLLVIFLALLAACGGGSGPTAIAPYIVAQPMSQTVSEGTSVSFSAAAGGDAPLSYQWKRDGTNVDGATAPSYTLLAAKLSDSGSAWTVEVISAAGRVTSAPAILTVKPVVAAGMSLYAGIPDGSGSVFAYPHGVAMDRVGNIYVADMGNHAIKKIAPGGGVTVLAGKPGTSGSADGKGAAARFLEPSGVAIDDTENVYVTDSGNYTVRKISKDGVVTTMAGSVGVRGNDDGTASAARFWLFGGIAVDAAGNVFVSDFNSTIRKITPAGVVTTFAGLPDVRGFIDGSGAAARFSVPAGLSFDAGGNLFAVDVVNGAIRKISPGGAVITLTGMVEATGNVGGIPIPASLDWPYAITVDGAGNMYVGDKWKVRKITPAAIVSTLAGGDMGAQDGTGADARFSWEISGLAVDAAGFLYIADFENNAVRKVSASGVVTTIAGTLPRPSAVCSPQADGTAATAKFCDPSDLAIDKDGNVYIADSGSHTVRKVTPAGMVSTFAGQPGVVGMKDGRGGAALFNRPSGVAVDSAGIVYVADKLNHRIRKISSDGEVSTLAGADWPGPLQTGHTIVPGSTPSALAVDKSGTVYVIDNGVFGIRKVSANGSVSEPAGVTTLYAMLTSIPLSPRELTGIAVDDVGDIFVSAHDTVFMLAPDGTVTLLAGQLGKKSPTDGPRSTAQFGDAKAVALDGAGGLYVADTGNNTIRLIAPDGAVNTVVGVGGSGGILLGPLPGRIDAPTGLAFDRNGALYTLSEKAIVRIRLNPQ